MKEYLRTVPLFSDLADEDIELLARASEERQYAEGTHIIRLGEPGRSAFVLKEGAADAVLERPGGSQVTLSKIVPGEVFGEIALFDGEPRSVSVVATRNSSVIELSREMFVQEIAKRPETSLKLLAAISKRLRRSEGIVSNFADRIYGDVMPRLEAAVSAQLDSAKVIYEQSKDRVAQVSEQARQVVEHVESRWTQITWIGALVGAGLVVAGGIAAWAVERYFQGIEEERETHRIAMEGLTSNAQKELSAIKNQAEELVKGLESDRKSLNYLKEINLQMQRLRHDLNLEGDPEPAFQDTADVGGTARDFFRAKDALIETYFGSAAVKFEPEILVEAITLLVDLEASNFSPLDASEWARGLDGVEHALRNPSTDWRPRQRLERAILRLHKQLKNGSPSALNDLIERMEDLVADRDATELAKRQTALILARMGHGPEAVKQVLRDALRRAARWSRSQAAAALIAVGDASGWDQIRDELGQAYSVEKAADNSNQEQQARRRAGFAAALLLAENAYAPPSRGLAHHFSAESIDRELAPSRLGIVPGTLQGVETGVELVSHTIREGMRPDDSVFYWRFSCDLICDLGCSASGDASGGESCGACYDDMLKTFPVFEWGDRAADAQRCAIRG